MNKKCLLSLQCIIGLISISLIALPGSAGLQTQSYNPEHRFSPEQLKEDFAVFRTALEEAHGAIYRYTPKEIMDGRFDSTFAGLKKSMTEREFYRLLLPIIADVNCGHTGMTFSREYNNYFREAPLSFPFGLRFIGEKIYIYYNFSDNPGIERGSELLTVNGRSGAEIVSTMLPFISSDAHIQTSKYRRMEDPAFFGMLFLTVFGPESSFSVRCLPPGQTAPREFTCKGINAQEIRRMAEERYPETGQTDPLRSLVYKEGIPILTIKTFGGAVNRGDVSFKEFLRNSFVEFEQKGVPSLIIDLRNNTGGNDDFGRFLFAHLIDEPFQYYESLELKNIELSVSEHTSLTPSRVEYLKNNTRKNDHGTYDVLGHPNLGILPPFEPTFRGKVFVLINGRSFSATGESTSLMHFYKKAEFVGEECGAGYYGNTSGATLALTLPNSKIQARIPQIRYAMAVSGYPSDRGIIPEHPVTPTIEELLSGKDVVMEYALKLAHGSEKAAEDPPTLEEYQFVARGRMSRERGERPTGIARMDNNGEILIACREAKSADQLKSSGINFKQSQLELLVDWDLLEYDGKAKTYQTKVHIYGTGQSSAIRRIVKPAAEQLAKGLDQDLLALKDFLESIRRQKSLYAVLFGYILHSYSMEQFAEEIYQKPQLSAEKPFWNGYAWAIYPIEGFNTGVTFLPVEEHKLFCVSATTAPRLDFRQLAALAKDAAIDHQVNDLEIIKAFEAFNIFDENGILTIPVFSGEWPERLEGMAKKVYAKTAELAESEEMTKLLGMETSAQSEMFLHYELRHAFLTHLLETGTMPAPVDFETADNNSPADVGSLLFLIAPHRQPV